MGKGDSAKGRKKGEGWEKGNRVRGGEGLRVGKRGEVLRVGKRGIGEKG